MRHRTTVLASAVLLSVGLSAACTRNPGRPPSPLVPPNALEDCGTLDFQNPKPTDQRVRDCWNGYHFGHFTKSYKMVTIDGDTTTTYQTVLGPHQVIITTESGGRTTTRTCGTNQVTSSQVFFDGAGKPQVVAC